jgi:DHA1 family bicyclomycin/chloramphenicol resistance-like MFS transporter
MLRSGTFALTALLAALTAIGPLSTDMYLPSLPDIACQLGATTAQVQLTISAYLIGFAVGQIFYGPVSDRHGRKPILLAALALYCVASLICALSTSIDMLIAARFAQALGGSGGIVLARAIVRDLHSGARAGRELSLIGSVMALAPVLAPLVGGVLQTGFGWRSVFVTLVAAGLAGAGIVWLRLPETLARRAAEPLSLASMLKSYRAVVRNPAYLAYVGLATTSFAGLFAWISGASFVLQNLYGLSPFTFGAAFALGSVGYMTGTTIAARLVMRFGIDGIVGLGSCTTAAGGLGMVAALALGFTSAVSLVLPVAVYLAGLGMVLPQAIAGAMTPFPERAGAASALLGFVQQSAAALCGAVVGWLLDENAWPLAAAVAVMGCATLTIWISTRGLRRRQV